jgi:hypothetical protein
LINHKFLKKKSYFLSEQVIDIQCQLRNFEFVVHLEETLFLQVLSDSFKCLYKKTGQVGFCLDK